MSTRFNPPPNWPAPPAGWTPPAGWEPDPAWGPAPEGWEIWVEEPAGPEAEVPPVTYGVVSPPSEGSTAPTSPATDPQPPETARSSRLKGRKPLLIAGASIAAIAVVVALVMSLNQSSPFESAHEACGSPLWAALGDDGDTLVLDMEGNESAGMSLEDTVCILNELNVPQSVIARMDSTRALDGVQTGEWDEIVASWSYHPDDGLDVILERAK